MALTQNVLPPPEQVFYGLTPLAARLASPPLGSPLAFYLHFLFSLYHELQIS